jgi:DNA-binding transcriptional ArsR family regulator
MTSPAPSEEKTATSASSGRLFKILSHPLRHRILVMLNEMEEGSPTQLAGRLGEPVGNVSYHVKVLAEANAIELARTEPRRGALEHFYRPIDQPQITRVPLHLDGPGHDAVRELIEETAKRLHQIQDQAVTRADSVDDLAETEVAILHYQRDQAPAQ